MEWAQNAVYELEADGYSAAPVPGTAPADAVYADYANYSAIIDATPLSTPDGGLQKITVTIKRSGVTVFVLEGFKRDG